MAQILYLVREESSQSQLENGVSGVGALQTREFGYTEEKQEFSFKTNAGPFRHLPTREKLLLGAAAATSGAKLIGYYPASGLSSVTVQDALDELRAQVAAGGGGTTLGSGTAGALTKWVNGTTLGNSILTESGSAIRFSGDAVANLYRNAAGVLKTDGAFVSVGNLTGDILNVNRVYSGLFLTVTAPSSGDTENIFAATFQRNTTGAIEHSLLKAYAALNSGGSNASEILNLIEANTVNTAVTGMTVNLMNLKYGGAEKFKVSSAGNTAIAGTLSVNGSSAAVAGDFAVGGSKLIVNGSTGYTNLNGFLYQAGSAIISGYPVDWGGSLRYLGLHVYTSFDQDISKGSCLGVGGNLLPTVDLTDFYRVDIEGEIMQSGATITNLIGLNIRDCSNGSTSNRAIKTGLGLVDFGDRLLTKASVSGKAGLNVPHGTAPSSPVDGDIWTTTAGLYVRINGATVGPLT